MATPQPSGAVSSSLITGPAPNGAVLMCTLKRFAEGRSAPPKKPTKTGTDEAQVPAPNQIPCPGMPEASVLHDIRVGSSFPRYEKFSYLESQLNFKKIHAHLLQQERHSSFPACSHAWTKMLCHSSCYCHNPYSATESKVTIHLILWMSNPISTIPLIESALWVMQGPTKKNAY